VSDVGLGGAALRAGRRDVGHDAADDDGQSDRVESSHSTPALLESKK
jgi:hypothetical protein